MTRRRKRRDIKPKLRSKIKNDAMAEKSKRLPENVVGKYYIDSECINCDLCIEIAPSFFKKGEDSQNQFVYQQPSLPSEILKIKEAMESCPTEAIGDDGDLYSS